MKYFQFLFALPSPTDKLFPKCKSHLSRSACYDLLVEMVRGCLANYSVLHGLLVLQHQAASHKPYPWEYWPREEGRSECGYVGLVNLGATCYMVSTQYLSTVVITSQSRVTVYFSLQTKSWVGSLVI